MLRLALVLAFFASGAAALLFQVLWFRQLALSIGNTVWATSLVLGSFMGGLALGNLLAARWHGTAARALRAYALLETVIAACGLGLVVLLPRMPDQLAPLLREMTHPTALNVARLGIASVLMLIPTTAMGATLPLLMAGLARRRGAFGSALGRLYGWNTLGATAGALLADTWLVSWLGLTRTGMVAAGLNLLAASVAVALASRWPAAEPDQEAAREDGSTGRLGARALALAAAAALIGGCGLALEVISFRFLTTYVPGSSIAFALMLAVVLCGIALGGLVGGAWAGRSDAAHRWTAAIAAGAGIATTLAYATFPDTLRRLGIQYTASPPEVLSLAAALMGPTCLLSGCLFPLIGRALRDVLPTGRAAGVLTLSNTAGAMLGALLGGFVLLPGLGVERSFFAVSAAYGVAATVLAANGGRPAARRGLWIGVCAGAFLLVIALFPFGLMARVHVPRVATRYGDDLRLVDWREGLTETSLLLRGDLLGQPSRHILVTNGHPMSSTSFYSQRYMRLYFYWAKAVSPGIRRAALISYGVGNTAAALVESPDLESIDVVDISRDIVEVGRGIFPPGRFPLDDPRVRLHIEDGRFFLLMSEGRYDLITSEPPPPRLAGVANLYTREYFTLIRSRLAEGGLVTYWLPVHDLDRRSAASVIRGFCDAFPDCSLWTGSSLDWMLVGSRGARPRADEEAFGGQWRREPMRSSLVSIGLDSPERLGALFQGDGASLRELVGNAPALTDDFPQRIGPHGPQEADVAFYRAWMEPAACRRRFESSAFVRDVWPPALAARSLPFFEEQAMYVHETISLGQPKKGVDFARVVHALRETDARALPLVLLGSAPQEVAIAESAAATGRDDAIVSYLRGLGALSRREYSQAADLFDRVAEKEPSFGDLVFFRASSRCLAGQAEAAEPYLAAARERAADDPARRFWASLDCR